METSRQDLPGSCRPDAPAQATGRVAGDTPMAVDVQLNLRDREALAQKILTPGYTPYTLDDFIQAHALTDADIATARRYFESESLSVTPSSDRRVLTLAGSAGNVERCFGTMLSTRQGGTIRTPAGTLSLPTPVAGLVEAVVGLDQLPVFRPHVRRRPPYAAPAGVVPLTVLQVARAYDFPAADGKGETIAIVELGGGYQQSDLDKAAKAHGLPAPKPIVIGVNGGSNNFGADPNADIEVALDIQMIAGLVPHARIVVIFSTPDDRGFLAAINAVISNHKKYGFTAVSISWGGPEDQITPAARHAMDSAFMAAAGLGISFLVAAGDNGSADIPGGTTVDTDYPASSPWTTACGGTRLVLNPNGSRKEEIVWNEEPNYGATGGGISHLSPEPAYQKGVKLPKRADGSAGSGRGEPDVASNADPFSGFPVVTNGQSQPIGGTSAAAPLWAGLTARLAQLLKRHPGFLNPSIYAGKGAGLHDITKGNNAIPAAPGVPAVPGYAAGPGWDAVTGWGAPDGQKLLQALKK